MRYVLLLLLLLSGCTLVPIDAGVCSGVSNARGCQENPYINRSSEESASRGDESQKTGAVR
jgi:hypothetical protein